MSEALRTTVGIKGITKSRLDKNRAPGQCYDGFIGQLIDLWEQDKEERASDRVRPARAGQVVGVGHS